MAVYSDDPDDIVLAYVGEELRGVAKLDVDGASQQFAFVTIHSIRPQTLTNRFLSECGILRGLTFTSVETLGPMLPLR